MKVSEILRGRRTALVTAALAVSLAAGTVLAPSVASAKSAKSQAAKVVAKYSKQPQTIGITTPIHKKIPKNKTIAFIQCSIPSCTILGTYITQAGKALGWKVDRINGGLTPETVKAAYDQAVSIDPAAVVGTGFPKTIFAPELATLQAKHIPVIELSVATSPGGGITAVFDGKAANTAAGQLQANWVFDKLGSSAKALVIGLPTFPTITIEEAGFKSEYKKLCPSCTLDQVTVTATDIGTPTVTSTVVGFLESHRTINVVETSDSDIVIGLPAALSAAGLNPKIVVLDASPTVAQYIKAGQVSISTAVAWPTLMWIAVDTVARKLVGESIKPDLKWVEPQWIVDATNIPSTSHYYGVEPTGKMHAQFKKIWGVKKSKHKSKHKKK